jgi:anti-sigma B factor antagonist
VQEAFGFAPGIDYLFLVQAPGGTLAPKPGGEADRYVVTLERPASAMQWFSNRPQRLAGHNTLLNFVRVWEMLGFGEDPPNTAIALTEGAAENEDTLIVEMFAPVLNPQGTTLTFEARVLRDDEAHGLAYYAGRADRTLPSRFGPVSLFVDSAAVQVVKRQVGDVTILDLKGKITIGTGDVQLRNAVQEVMNSGAMKVLINMRDVSTIDSSGIGELVSLYTTATNRGAKLKLINLPAKVTDILTITQLITVFDVYDSEAAGIQSFA